MTICFTRAAVLFCRPNPQEAGLLGYIKPQMNLRIYHIKKAIILVVKFKLKEDIQIILKNLQLHIC
jgi:hypothetical protein